MRLITPQFRLFADNSATPAIDPQQHNNSAHTAHEAHEGEDHGHGGGHGGHVPKGPGSNIFQAARLRQPAISVQASPQAGVGVSVGCFAGAGYGLTVGFGSIVATTPNNNNALVVPSLKAQAFAHDGALVGAFCGVVLGGGVASGIGAHFGFRWTNLFDGWFQFVGSNFRKAFGPKSNDGPLAAGRFAKRAFPSTAVAARR